MHTFFMVVWSLIYNVYLYRLYCWYIGVNKKMWYKDRNKRHSSPFINVVKGVFFVVRVTLVLVSYMSAPSAVHSYRVPINCIFTDNVRILHPCNIYLRNIRLFLFFVYFSTLHRWKVIRCHHHFFRTMS
jgi:hypothetical protein